MQCWPRHTYTCTAHHAARRRNTDRVCRCQSLAVAQAHQMHGKGTLLAAPTHHAVMLLFWTLAPAAREPTVRGPQALLQHLSDMSCVHSAPHKASKRARARLTHLVVQVRHKAAARVQLAPVRVAAAWWGRHCPGHQVQWGVLAMGADAIEPDASWGPLAPLLQQRCAQEARGSSSNSKAAGGHNGTQVSMCRSTQAVAAHSQCCAAMPHSLSPRNRRATRVCFCSAYSASGRLPHTTPPQHVPPPPLPAPVRPAPGSPPS